MPELNSATIRDLMNQLGLTQTKLVQITGLSDGTVRSALRGKNVSPDTQVAIANALRISPGAILLHPPRNDSSGHYRNISGRWVGTAEDIIVPGHIEYDISPVTYQFNMTIRQIDHDFEAEGGLFGQEGTEQPFEAKGHLKEDGNYVVLEWWNADPKVHDYGIGILEHTADAKWLKGYFVGRERIHNLTVIFGKISARRSNTSKTL